MNREQCPRGSRDVFLHIVQKQVEHRITNQNQQVPALQWSLEWYYGKSEPHPCPHHQLLGFFE